MEMPLFQASSLASNIVNTFDTMPLIPGRVALMVLLLMSSVSWSILLSKMILISRIRRADRDFRRRLKRSRTCLEVYQSGENHEPSLLFDVYHEGARAASMEITGLPDPLSITEDRIAAHGPLTRSQINAIDDALEHGERIGADRIEPGFNLLRMVSTIVPILGIVTASWVLITALNADGVSFRLLLSYALLMIIASLLVTAPAGMGRLDLLNQCRRRALKTRRFRSQVLRVFTDSFEPPAITPEPEPETIPIPIEPEELVAEAAEEPEREPETIPIPVEPEELVAEAAEEPAPEIEPEPITIVHQQPQPVVQAEPMPVANTLVIEPAPTPIEPTPEPQPIPVAEPIPAANTMIIEPAPIAPLSRPETTVQTPIASPFELDDGMTDFESAAHEVPGTIYDDPIVPNFDKRQPVKKTSLSEKADPYVSANY